jgi:signal transduction histidine kinase
VWGGRAREKGLAFESAFSADLPATLRGDPNKLVRVVAILLDNAVKFTDQGSVRFEARAEHDGLVRFTCSDTGIGLSLDGRDSLFEIFSQGEDAYVRHYGGVGLNLAIAAKLVELMGGRIWVESDAGQGARFHFTVAVCPNDQQANGDATREG